MRSTIFLFLFCFFFLQNTIAQSSLKLNQIQIIASHNSYKKVPNPKVNAFLQKIKKQLGKEDPRGLDYGHLPFDSQFSNYKIRGLEIDINNDPKGGLYYKRKINAFICGLKENSGIAELKKPGLKVLHVKDVDFETNYYTFKQALTAVKKWSDAHPKHLPLLINLEAKGVGPGDRSGAARFLGFKRSIPFDDAAADSIDAEIKSIFGADAKNILTPDRLRGNFSTLDEMATHNGWPALEDCLGKIVFILQGQALDESIKNHEGLKGRLCVMYAHPGKPECAFVKMDEPEPVAKIQALVKKGYMVRTRSDEETNEARSNDYHRMNSAFESGAQIISTDYYKPDLRFNTFSVHFPNREAGRINPVNGGNVKTELPGD